jgi:purine-binding chemotaxis protein CheW
VSFNSTQEPPLAGAFQDGAFQVISFVIGDQEFCLDISDILEIRGWTPTTPVAHSVEYVKGVISLRGVVMAVIDLSERLGFGPTRQTDRNVIIVARHNGKPVGLLVQAVSESMVIPQASIQSAEAVIHGVAPEFVRGFVPMESRMLTVLQLSHLLPEGYQGAAEAA